jgi:uncharacterized protein YbbK (DUF523 family)
LKEFLLNVLVSACLLGRPVRYDGSAKTVAHAALARWAAEGRLVALCPELAAGFTTPRPPVEIGESRDGSEVLAGRAVVREATGADVTSAYLDGARVALSLARRTGCRFALLTDGSPSCGSRFIYDGSFSGQIIEGVGVTAALLRENGVEVFTEAEIGVLSERMSRGPRAAQSASS